jgi:hypothetical protein
MSRIINRNENVLLQNKIDIFKLRLCYFAYFSGIAVAVPEVGSVVVYVNVLVFQNIPHDRYRPTA